MYSFKVEMDLASSAQMRFLTLQNGRQYLFGQQLLAQRVEGDKLPSEDASVKEALGHQHDFTDQLEIWHHHGTGSVDV